MSAPDTAAPSPPPGAGHARSFAVPALLLVLAIAFGAFPAFDPPPFFESFLYLLFFWIALATSWTILSGFTGYVSFGHGAFFGAGVYTLATLAPYLPFWAALTAAGLVAALLALVVGAIVFRVKRLRGELFALLTLALAFILATIVLNTPIDGGPGVFLTGVSLPRLYGNTASTIYLLGASVGLASLLVAWAVQNSRLGRGLFAISDDEDVAEVQGVPTFWYKLAAFAISSFIAGVAGGVHAVFLSYVTVGETFSITVPLFVLLMSVLGGARHWAGPAIGAVFVTLLSYSFTSGDWALAARALIGLTLVLATLFFSDGLMGFVEKRRDASRRRAKQHDPQRAVLGFTSRSAEPAREGSGWPLLTCTEVRLAFRGIKALDGVNLDIREGEILGLVGPNGSGKSTLINVISGFYKPDAGKLELRGVDVARLEGHRIARLGVARTYQIPRPFARQSVIENVALAGMFGAAGLSYQAAKAQALEWLAFVGLSARADALPSELNLHQRKFLELARALAARPRLVMLDEVLAGLTPSEINSAIAMVRRIREQGATILFVEHNMRAVLELTERLVVLNHGRVIAAGAPRDVMADAQVVSAYLGADDAAA